MPLFIVALAIPLVLRLVPPNSLYGFRTTKTLSSPEIWFPANRASGLFLIGGAVLSAVFNVILWTQSAWPESKLVLWMANSIGVSALLSLAASLLYLRKL